MSDLKITNPELLNRPNLTAREIYPAPRELDWAKPGQGALQVQVLGSETKVIVIAADPAILDRLKL
jgi:hypothetical protein